MRTIILGFILFNFIACAQQNDRSYLGEDYARKELTAALQKKDHNIVDNKTIIIKDSTTAINVAEPILFGIYGKENIVKQKPYEIYHLDNFWVLGGTLPQNMMGGTFLIILDDRNGNILKITHGK